MGGGQSAARDCLDAICNGRSGCVAYPENPLYKISWALPYNLANPVTPVAVFRPDTAQDVADAVKCAVEYGFRVQAKSGGHSYGNHGLGGVDGALSIDLVNLRGFKMNNETWQATVGSGMHLGELDEHLHENGKRAIAHGTCPDVGIGGHATIGGLGPMSRMWGSTLDHVVEVEVVTAAGEIVRANETTNPALFWAVRGAGASFGIVTEFVVKTRPEPGEVVEYTYSVTFGLQEKMAPLFRQWQDLIGDPDLDRRFSSLLIVQPLGVIITGTFYGTGEEYWASGIHDRIPGGGNGFEIKDWMGSLAHQAERDFMYLSSLPVAFYSKSLAFRRQDLLSNETTTDLFGYMSNNSNHSPLWCLIFNSEGGAMADTPAQATAYPHRDKVMMYQSYGLGITDVSDETRRYLDGIHGRIQAGAPEAASTYAGYVDTSVGRDAAQRLYWADQLDLLRVVKKRWDPDDVFRNPQSIEPA